VRSALETGYVGFKVGQVAASMGITVDELLRANEAGLLRLENKTVKREASEGMLFRLSFGDRYCVASTGPV